MNIQFKFITINLQSYEIYKFDNMQCTISCLLIIICNLITIKHHNESYQDQYKYLNLIKRNHEHT